MTKLEQVLEFIPDNWNNIKSFLENYKMFYHFEYDDEFNTLIIDEVDVGEKQYLINIDLENETIKFVDDLVHVDPVNHYGYLDEIDFDEWNNALNKLIEDVNGYHFKLSPGESGNEDYLWYNLVCNISDFSEENLLTVTKLWDHYNKNRRSLYNS